VEPQFSGRVALVTGGGSGIGRAVTEALVAAGASVGVLERDEAKCEQLAAGNDRTEAFPGDATSAADNRSAVEAVVRRFGRLDVLLTFVGVFDNYIALAEIPEASFEDAYREVFDVNVKSVLLAVRAARSELVRRGGNVVVTCSSSSFYAGRGGSLYVASKHALRGLVVQLARELAPSVRVNGVAPGGTIATDLRGARSLGHAEVRLDDRPDREAGLRERTPLEVALRPEQHVGAYLYLASDAAPGVTGEIIRSDGGLIAR
jgi:NAD(P)-dependent dehydrogenase (short-subunit alcohol dehydrogenase family)